MEKAKEHDPSTEILLVEAERRGITATGFPDVDPNFLILEYRGHREFLGGGASNRLGYPTMRACVNKALTRAVLKQAGYPVPDEIITDQLSEAENFLKKYRRVVIKPMSLSLGRGITPNITNAQHLSEAFAFARAATNKADADESAVICQQHVAGHEYRICVIDQKHVFAVERIPAQIEGDGQRTVRQLVDDYNNATIGKHQIKITDKTDGLLGEQGLGWDKVPDKKQAVMLAKVANAYAGGTFHDVTGDVCAEASQMALDVAVYMQLPVMGLDCISPDISKTLGTIIEINSICDITLHSHPTTGQPRDVARLIIDLIFPETQA